VKCDDLMAEDIIPWVKISADVTCCAITSRRLSRFNLPGAKVFGTVVVQVLLFAISTPVAQTCVEKLIPDSSILTNLRVLLAT